MSSVAAAVGWGLAILNKGDRAPDFTASADGGRTVRLASLRGRKIVLYFYPRDNTPGCTTQACTFRDQQEWFDARNTVILGVSPDSVSSHDLFKAKHDLPFHLISDPDHTIAKAYGVWREKTLFGKRYMGIVRSTFVVDERGIIEAVFDRVKVRGHAERVLTEL